MNLITIAGTLGKDCQTRTTQTGDSVTGFSVAVNEGKDKTTWFNCSYWGERGTKVAPYLLKGKRVTLSGRVSARCHEGKAYLEVSVGQLTLMSPASEGRDDRSSGGGSGGYGGQQDSRSAPIDDEIPF